MGKKKKSREDEIVNAAVRTGHSPEFVARVEADVVKGMLMHNTGSHLRSKGGSMLIPGKENQTTLPSINLNATKSNDLLEYTKKIKNVNKDAELALTNEGTRLCP